MSVHVDVMTTGSSLQALRAHSLIYFSVSEGLIKRELICSFCLKRVITRKGDLLDRGLTRAFVFAQNQTLGQNRYNTPTIHLLRTDIPLVLVKNTREWFDLTKHMCVLNQRVNIVTAKKPRVQHLGNFLDVF